MSKFKFSGKAEVLHINARKEGNEESKELALDVKFQAVTGIEVADFFEPELKNFLFLQGGAIRNIMLGPLAYSHELEHYRLEAMGSAFNGVKVKKFQLSPIDGGGINFIFSISIKPSGDEVARLAEYLQDEIDLTLEPESGELDFGASGNASTAFSGLAETVARDGASMTITDGNGNVLLGAGNEHDPLYSQAVYAVGTSGRASISHVQRVLRIGYNHAARLIEQMEKDGLVTPMKSNGAREVTAAGKELTA